MLPPADGASGGERNHPLAKRMAIIAFFNQNITIGCIFGSFSVLLGAVEARLGVGRELSTLGIPAVTLATAICAPIVGALATKGSLKLVLLTGSILGMLGYLLLAFTASFPLYLVAFGLLIGPGMAAGVILPATLVTRWFVVNRGRTLGMISTQVLIVLMPIVSIWMLQRTSLQAAYLLLAALSAVSVIANLFIVDRPPGSEEADGEAAHGGSAGDWTMARLLRTPRFWSLIFPFIASATATIILAAHTIPIVQSWGITGTRAATLVSVQSFVGIAGTLLFGWIADRIGGARALLLVAVDGAILYALMLTEPSYGVAMVLVGLFGLHSAGSIPALSMALSEAFGRESFSRAFGLGNLVNLPFSVACVPLASLVFARTGSYAGAILGAAVFLGIAALILAPALRTRRI